MDRCLKFGGEGRGVEGRGMFLAGGGERIFLVGGGGRSQKLKNA